MPIPMPDQDFLRESLDYNAETGELRWCLRPRAHFASDRHWKSWNSQWAGSVASTIMTPAYPRRQIRVGGRYVMAHRIIWKWMTGEDPPEVDHIDGDGMNNRWRNLRSATHGQNMCNRRSTPRALPRGVYATRSGKRWFAKIQVSRRQISLGTFDCPDAAHAAYCEAARFVHGGFGRADQGVAPFMVLA